MTGKKEILAIPDGSVLNPDHMQYYRIRFSKNTTAQLKKQLIHNQSKFTANDRIGIISDMFFNLQARKMKLEQVIDFLEYFKVRTSFTGCKFNTQIVIKAGHKQK